MRINKCEIIKRKNVHELVFENLDFFCQADDDGKFFTVMLEDEDIKNLVFVINKYVKNRKYLRP